MSLDGSRCISKLLNSMIEVCVVVGMDQDTGLVPTPEEREGLDPGLIQLFNVDYETHIFAALSAQSASFPFVLNEIEGEPFYPRASVIAPTPPVKGGGKGRNCKARLPILQDVIDGLTPFCFPDGAQVRSTKQPSVGHTLVLTDLEGNRTYCVCMTFFRPFMARKRQDGLGQFDLLYMNEGETKVVSGSGYIPCYVPACCCLISKWPYFDLMKQCLSSLLPKLEGDARHFRRHLMKFVSQLAMMPVPPPGSLAIDFEFCGVRHVVKPAQNPEVRVVDMELHYPFLCFSVDDILVLISCILTQHRLVFMASSYATITLVIESLFTYIQPFVWSWTYVPVLPSKLLDLIEAPGVYIMGCNSRHFEQVKNVMETYEMSGVVIANIDDGTITFAKNLNVPPLPLNGAATFKLRMKDAQWNFDLLSAQRPAWLCLEDAKKQRQEFAMKFQTLVLAAFQEMMKRLFGDISSHISLESYFDKDEFIGSRLDCDHEFYSMACNSHAFTVFLNDWIAYPEKRKFFQDQSCSTPRSGPLRKRSSSMRTTINVEEQFAPAIDPDKDLNTLALPPFTDEGLHKGSFYKECLTTLNEKIEAAVGSAADMLAGYHYLRGMFHLACGQHIQALDDFYALSSRNAQLFPTETVNTIAKKLTDEEMNQLKSRSFNRKIEAMRHRFRSLDKQRKHVVTSAVPSGPLGEEAFVRHVNLLQICTSREAGRILFQCVRPSKKSQDVDRDEFMSFYESFNQANTEASTVSMLGVALREDEVVLKVSHNLIKTDRGMGRILMSVERLLFMLDGTNKWEEITSIRNIGKVEPYQHYVVFPPGVPALRITGRRHTQPFIVCLKEERDFWCQCIRELQTAHKTFANLKDDQVLKKAAQNIILADALRRSGCPTDTVNNILYLRQRPPQELDKITRQELVARISPSPQDMEEMTVESMVSVSESTVWCALGSPDSGLIGIIETGTWKCMAQFRQGQYRVSRLLYVDSGAVWAASLDTIYIISPDNKQADQQLHGHSDFISHMIKVEEDDGTSTVWSAGCDGHIISWDPDTLSSKREFKLRNVKRLFSFVKVGSRFWYGTKTEVRISDLTGKDEQVRTVHDKKGHTLSIGCICLVSENRVWTGCDTKGQIAVWDTETLKTTMKPTIKSVDGLTEMLCVGTKVWVGGKSGGVFVLDAETGELEKTLQLHSDRVRSMCITGSGHVLSGPGSKDGHIAVWNSHLSQENDDPAKEEDFFVV